MTIMSDLEKLRATEQWPLHPKLPLKRYIGQSLELGIILADDPTTVILTNLYTRAADMATAKRLTYPSSEALLADGWTVD